MDDTTTKKPRRKKSRPSAPHEVSAARLKKFNDLPRHLRALFTAAWTGRSRKLALKAMCVECMGYQRALVKGCTSLACPLYPWRPFQSDSEKAEVEAQDANTSS